MRVRFRCEILRAKSAYLANKPSAAARSSVEIGVVDWQSRQRFNDERTRRVGFVCDTCSPAAGGAYVLQTSLEEAIRSTTNPDNFIRVTLADPKRFRHYHNVRGHKPSSKEFLNFVISDLALDMIWFLTPMAEPVCVPFIATVWDVAHRQHPIFPEVNVEGWWTWQKREQTYRETLPRAARVLTGTQSGKDAIHQFYGVPLENISIVPLPVPDFGKHFAQLDTAISLAKYNLPDSYLFYPAQFWPHKNHVNLMLALKCLKEKYDLTIPLVLTGADKGNLPHVKTMAHRYGIERLVHILGFVPREDVVQLYRGAIALVFPTFFGPDNLPPLEAFALGCPVIASRVKGVEEQLGDAALLFDPADPAQLAVAIATVVSDQALRARLIKRGFENASAKSAITYVCKVLQIIEELEPFRRCWSPGANTDPSSL
jgi:glycosyltransferase involved in cell wall biosynthesis